MGYKGSLFDIHNQVSECPMQKVVPILLVIVLLGSGCLQPTVESQEKLDKYIHPDSGFTMKYPESWNITDRSLEFYQPNHSRIVFSSPDNQAAFIVDIKLEHHPEGKELGGVGLSYERPNATSIASYKRIQVAGLNGTQWIILVKDPDREFYDNFIAITQICPGLQNNKIDYFFRYEYPAENTKMEETVYAILDSIEFPCPSEK